MTPEFLNVELDHAEEAELKSDEQLRQLTDLIDKTCGPNPGMNASDCAKVVTAALALNDRLRARTEKLRDEIRVAAHRAEAAIKSAKSQATTARVIASLNGQKI